MTSSGDWMSQAWTAIEGAADRVLERTAAPEPFWLGATAAVVLAAVLYRPTWRVLRHPVTLVHEAGHGFAATMAGRRLSGIRLHSDTSGLTVSVGRPRGFGMALTLLAGYPAASIVGVLMASAIAAGHATATLWGALVLLALVLVQIRNWFGLWSVLASGVVVGSATWFLDATWRGLIAVAIDALLLAGGLRASIELQAARRRTRGAVSDADQLASVAHLPGILWVGLFVAIGLAAPCAAAWLLLPH